MLRAQGHSETASFLLRTLFCETLGLRSGAYIECPRPQGWGQVVDRYRELIRAHNVHTQHVILRLQRRFLSHVNPL